MWRVHCGACSPSWPGSRRKLPVDLIVVQDRVTRADGEPLGVAVQRTRRVSTTLLTIRLAPRARGTCYGPEAVAATLADTLAALCEREAQATPVLEVPARLPKKVRLLSHGGCGRELPQPTGLQRDAGAGRGTRADRDRLARRVHGLLAHAGLVAVACCEG